MELRGLGMELGTKNKDEIVGMMPTHLRERYAKYLCGIEFDWTLWDWHTHIKFGIWRQVKFERQWYGPAPFYWSPDWQLKIRFLWFALDMSAILLDEHQYRRWLKKTAGLSAHTQKQGKR